MPPHAQRCARDALGQPQRRLRAPGYVPGCPFALSPPVPMAWWPSALGGTTTSLPSAVPGLMHPLSTGSKKRLWIVPVDNLPRERHRNLLHNRNHKSDSVALSDHACRPRICAVPTRLSTGAGDSIRSDWHVGLLVCSLFGSGQSSASTAECPLHRRHGLARKWVTASRANGRPSILNRTAPVDGGRTCSTGYATAFARSQRLLAAGAVSPLCWLRSCQPSARLTVTRC